MGENSRLEEILAFGIFQKPWWFSVQGVCACVCPASSLPRPPPQSVPVNFRDGGGGGGGIFYLTESYSPI